jgi:chromosome segregation ATPase
MSDSESSDARLKQINDELSRILEEKLEFLTRTLSETQRFTQKIASTELEIQRNTAQRARLETEKSDLEGQLAGLNEQVATATSARDAQQQDKYAREKEIQRLEWEISDKRKANEESTGRIGALEAELDATEKEIKKLQNRISVLEEGVARMKKLREEYQERIAGLDQEMKNVTGGGE